MLVCAIPHLEVFNATLGFDLFRHPVIRSFRKNARTEMADFEVVPPKYFYIAYQCMHSINVVVKVFRFLPRKIHLHLSVLFNRHGWCL